MNQQHLWFVYWANYGASIPYYLGASSVVNVYRRPPVSVCTRLSGGGGAMWIGLYENWSAVTRNIASGSQRVQR